MQFILWHFLQNFLSRNVLRSPNKNATHTLNLFLASALFLGASIDLKINNFRSDRSESSLFFWFVVCSLLTQPINLTTLKSNHLLRVTVLIWFSVFALSNMSVLSTGYDWYFVGLSFSSAVMGSYCGLQLIDEVKKTNKISIFIFWNFLAAFAFGGTGVWATHFIGK